MMEQKRLLTSDKDIDWHFAEMESHIREIKELYERGSEPYGEEETCREHAKVEAYDLIVLTAEAFGLADIIEHVPQRIIERFNKKRLQK